MLAKVNFNPVSVTEGGAVSGTILDGRELKEFAVLVVPFCRSTAAFTNELLGIGLWANGFDLHRGLHRK